MQCKKGIEALRRCRWWCSSRLNQHPAYRAHPSAPLLCTCNTANLHACISPKNLLLLHTLCTTQNTPAHVFEE